MGDEDGCKTINTAILTNNSMIKASKRVRSERMFFLFMGFEEK